MIFHKKGSTRSRNPGGQKKKKDVFWRVDIKQKRKIVDITEGNSCINGRSRNQDLYLFIIRGAMNQIAFLQDFETPPAPRSRPLRLPLHLEHTLHLKEDPQKLELGECQNPAWPHENRRLNKSSILKFLDLKHRPNKKLSPTVK